MLTSTVWSTPLPDAELSDWVASRFREANLSASIDWVPFWSKHVVVSADWVRNYGFDRKEILARTGQDIAPRVIGMQERVRSAMSPTTRGTRGRFTLDIVASSVTLSSMRLPIPTSGSVVQRQGYYMAANALVSNTTFGVRWYSANRSIGRRWQSTSCSWMLSPPSRSSHAQAFN